MAEGASTSKAAAQDEATRGRPHYEKLRRDLKMAIERKRAIDADIANLDQEISRAEDEYLETTSAAGNLIRGFDNYIKASGVAGAASVSASGPGTATRRKGGISDSDRIFSRSSVGWTPSDDVNTNVAAALRKDDGKGSGRDTPGSQGNGVKAGGKNKKKGDKDDEEERPSKRGKVSWGRD